ADQFSSETRLPVYVHGDIAKINFEHLGKLDCMVGGPPCQDFSITRGKGERKGIEVSRGKLYSHFVRALARTQPKVFFFENVPGLISANKATIKTMKSEASICPEPASTVVPAKYSRKIPTAEASVSLIGEFRCVMRVMRSSARK
ncbi:MAG: DNA cytosine methyltransferase, partial [candidate division Zixibacteria bacterium]|nr:DNA cytosine methyltransferase [candidate division Zixibacteria bacterium]